MTRRRFRIATSGRVGPPRWWWVILHDSLEEMRRAGARWHASETEEFYAEALGLCQPVGWWENDEEPDIRYYPETGYAGVLRFVPEHATSEVVAHELVHAAIAVYRMNCSADACLGENCGDEEEDLAYIYGELFASFHARY